MLVQHNFSLLFKKFIANSNSGKRLNKDGSRIKPQSISNYIYCDKLLQEFSVVKKFDLHIHQIKGDNLREHNKLKKYHLNFYKQFTSFLYKEKNCHDNYVGQTIKQIRTFYGWVNNIQGINTGNYYKSYYITKEDTPILTLSVEQLLFLVSNSDFENSLTPALKRTKDIFVFGCIVGLRFSDLLNIKQSNIEIRDGFQYLKVRSIKTATYTMVKLPHSAIKLVEKYHILIKRRRSTSITIATKNKGIRLFPLISLDRFNTNVKKIGELAGWTYSIPKLMTKTGLGKQASAKLGVTRFCDALSSHAMRRTSITTMLVSGMPEFIVKKISGHTNDSKSFFRYVNLAQSLMDKEIEKMHKHFEIAV